jgi:hypothetical protein
MDLTLALAVYGAAVSTLTSARTPVTAIAAERRARREDRLAEASRIIADRLSDISDDQVLQRLLDERTDELLTRCLTTITETSSAAHRHALALVAAEGLRNSRDMDELLYIERIIEELMTLDVDALRILTIPHVPNYQGHDCSAGWTLVQFIEAFPLSRDGAHRSILSRLQAKGLVKVANIETWDGQTLDGQQFAATDFASELVDVISDRRNG